MAESEKGSKMKPFPLQQWLADGWILQLRPAHGASSLFWLGWGGEASTGSDSQDFNPESATQSQGKSRIWTPDFFELPSSKPTTHRSFLEISGEDLRAALLQGRQGSSEVPWARVDWDRPAQKKDFQTGFDLAQRALQSHELRKIVPVLLSSGLSSGFSGGFSSGPAGGFGVSADLPFASTWLLERILAGLDSTSKAPSLRLYGKWRGGEGFIGATPEDLFSIEPGSFRTMAVAGTRTIDRASELVKSEKDQREHSIVVESLVATINRVLTRRHSDSTQISLQSIKVGRTEVRAFGALAHLVTEITVQFPKNSIPSTDDFTSDFVLECAAEFHPTPALGLDPRPVGPRPDLSWLKRLDEACGVGEQRGGFGAPFIVEHGARTEAVVAIRQVRFRTLGEDRMRVTIGAGCGLVLGSEFESEWNELMQKRQAVAGIFRLQSEGLSSETASHDLIRTLIESGAKTFIVCAGARNAPLMSALEGFKNQARVEIEVLSFFDERSASFFALGRARAMINEGSRGFVVVMTTSGTAVTELHSAIAEADLSGVPLLALTADRPMRLRGSGAPQSIDQRDVFGPFVEWSLDLEASDRSAVSKVDASLAKWTQFRPAHLNWCLDEPLFVGTQSADSTFDFSLRMRPLVGRSMGPKSPDERAVERLAQFLNADSPLVVVVGKLEVIERDFVRSFLMRLGCPVWLEGPSGLRGDPTLQAIEVQSGDEIVSKWVREGRVSRVMRIGGVPTLRAWRDLDEPRCECETFSVSSLRFSGLGRGSHLQMSLSLLESVRLVASASSREQVANAGRQLLIEDRSRLREREHDLGRSTFRQISNFLNSQASETSILYIGNSLPIREWDRDASRERVRRVEANRGVNGIDGQVSTALGLSKPESELWVIVGDLTALYDLNAFWAPKPRKMRVVVINNFGGQIFSAVFPQSLNQSRYLNGHELNFEGVARLWGLGYVSVKAGLDLERQLTDSLNAIDSSLSNHVLIEVREM